VGGQGHLDDLERERGCHGQCLYAVFPDAGGSWSRTPTTTPRTMHFLPQAAQRRNPMQFKILFVCLFVCFFSRFILHETAS
jgi:hypothetical protein